VVLVAVAVVATLVVVVVEQVDLATRPQPHHLKVIAEEMAHLARLAPLPLMVLAAAVVVLVALAHPALSVPVALVVRARQHLSKAPLLHWLVVVVEQVDTPFSQGRRVLVVLVALVAVALVLQAPTLQLMEIMAQ
jgi:hypothetical protein